MNLRRPFQEFQSEEEQRNLRKQAVVNLSIFATACLVISVLHKAIPNPATSLL